MLKRRSVEPWGGWEEAGVGTGVGGSGGGAEGGAEGGILG